MRPDLASQTAFALRPAPRPEVQVQYAALCYRLRRGKPQLLLVTSLRARRWIVPKGWPEPGMSPADCAAREAWEEAGVCGTVGHEPIGAFSYTKQGTLRRLPCLALVFALQVDRLDDDYPEVRRRKRRWFRRKTAAAAVRSPDLAQMLRDFDPRGQRR